MVLLFLVLYLYLKIKIIKDRNNKEYPFNKYIKIGNVFMKLIEVKQNLFSISKDYALAHCISADYALGSGIAKEFAKRGVKQQLE